MSITDTRTINELVKATGLPDETSLYDLRGLTTLAFNGLMREGIRTLGALAARSDEDLLDIRNFGVGCLGNVRTVLSQLAEQTNTTAD